MQLLFEMSICSALFYGLFVMLYQGKNNHQFNRFYLLVSLLLSIGIPLLDLPVFPQYVVPQILADNQVIVRDEVRENSVLLNWKNGLIALWITGIILNLFLLMKNILSLLKIVKNSEKRAGQNHIKVFTNGEIAVSSFFYYLFIPKEQEENISDYEIKHELTHIRQRHSLDILFVETIKAFFWFNPMIYLYKKRLTEIHEFLADQNTSNELGKEAYEAFLIHQITARQQPRLVHNFYSLFKKRLVMIQSNVSMKKWQYWAVFPILTLCFTLFSCGDFTVEKETYPAVSVELVG